MSSKGENFCLAIIILLGTLTLVSSYCPIGKIFSHLSNVKNNCAEIRNCTESYNKMSTANVVELHGYEVEEHSVVSEDGYITRLTRIINPMIDDDTRHVHNGQPVAIHHGLAQSPISPLLTFGCFDMSSPKASTIDDFNSISTGAHHDNRLTTIPYYLSNKGYDVWLLEARGCTSDSRGHTNKSKTDKSSEYWDFALDEQALYDLPAQIDYILEATGKPKLAYVGYSQSTTFMFQLLSERHSEYAPKLAIFVAIAPVAYLENATGLIEYVSGLPGSENHFSRESKPFLGSIDRCHKLNDMFVLLANNPVPMSAVVVKKLLEFGYGPDDSHNILSTSYLSSLVHATSYKALGHFLQIKDKDHFAKYDWGPRKNMLIYGQEHAPSYNLSRITFNKIVMFRGTKSDRASTVASQKRLIKELAAPLMNDYIMPEYYNHQSYFISKDSYKYVILPLCKEIGDAFGGVNPKRSP